MAFLSEKSAPEKAIGGKEMSKVGFLACIFGLIFGLGSSGPANAVDYSGEWTGTWEADAGRSGPLSAVITQQGSSLSGTIDVEDTVCGDFYDVEVSGDILLYNQTTWLQTELVYCPADQSYNKYSIDGDPLSGNTWSGTYELYSGPLGGLELWERGSFSLKRVTYMITASAGLDGSISPSGQVTVNAGADKTFTITPNTCYRVSDVQVDGSSVGAKQAYTFEDVSSNHTIHASFALASYSIEATAWPGGTISPEGSVPINCGADQTFTITPDTGYSVLDVQVDGVTVGAKETHTIEDVTANQTILASFQLDGSTCEVLMSEGFESLSMPPTGWTLSQTNSNNTWGLFTYDPRRGSYIAGVPYDAAVQQDEVLLTPTLRMVSGKLQFWSMGHPYWCRDTHDNCDLEVWIVVGGWDGGSKDDIKLHKAEDDWPAAWVFAPTFLDLSSSLLQGKPVRIGFRYKGLDGADAYIDDVQICYDRAGMAMPWIPLLLLED